MLAACRSVAALLLPTSCAVCNTGQRALCDECACEMQRTPRLLAHVHGLDVWSAWRFDEGAARVFHAYKDEGVTSLARSLAVPLRAVMTAATQGARNVALVPVPSSPRSWRRRGYAPVELMLRRARLPYVPLLRTQRRVQDQRGLDRAARQANMTDAFRLRKSVRHPQVPVVLVDDVATTGATLRAAAAALDRANVPVLAAVTVAWTPS